MVEPPRICLPKQTSAVCCMDEKYLKLFREILETWKSNIRRAEWIHHSFYAMSTGGVCLIIIINPNKHWASAYTLQCFEDSEVQRTCCHIDASVVFICTHTNADASRGLVVFKTHYVRDISETKKEHCNNMNEIHHNIPEETFGNPYIWYLLLILIRNKGHFFFIFKTIHLIVYVITSRLILPEYKQTDADAT